MYCLELGGLKWTYETAQEAWTNKHLEVRNSCSFVNLPDGLINGVRTFEEFQQHLDAGDVLLYHAMRAFKLDSDT